MKKLFTFLLLTSSLTVKAQYWTQKDTCSCVNGINATPAFVINSKAYVVNGGSPICFFYEYDPITDSWSQKSNCPINGIDGATSFTIGTKGYISCGYTSNSNNQVWEYDPASNNWVQKANFPGIGRDSPFSFSIGSDAFIGCGFDAINGSVLNDVWKYNQVSDSWIQVANFPYNYYILNGVGYNGSGYVPIGNTTSNTTEMWKYDTLLNTWSQKSSCSFAMYGTSSFLINDNMYVGMGYISSQFSSTDFWSYNITNDSWQQIPSFPGIGRDGPLSFSIGNKGYIGFGDIGPVFFDLYEFTPDSITGIAEMNTKELLISPNPTSTTLSLTPHPKTPFTFSIYNYTGIKVIEVKNQTTLNVATLPRGLYIAEVRDKEKVMRQKFVKQSP